MELEHPTIQERFIEIYHGQPGELKDKEKYINAVVCFNQLYKIREPWTSYNSFKNAQCKIHNK